MIWQINKSYRFSKVILPIILLICGVNNVNARETKSDKFINYKIQSGDTLEMIAGKYKTTVSSLIVLNHIEKPEALQIDENIVIPLKDSLKKINSPSYIVHKVTKDENLSLIAEKYNIALSKIVEFNKIKDSAKLKINQEILIPRDFISRGDRKIRNIKLSHRSLMSGINNNKMQLGRFFWPTTGGLITSGFGPRGYSFHSGVDIAGPIGTNVYSVLNGEVVFAGWQSGYGRVIDIKHSNDLLTRYAHLSSMSVSVGELVNSGDKIGAIGMSGHSTGPHLHFEVRIKGTAVNPVSYLHQ